MELTGKGMDVLRELYDADSYGDKLVLDLLRR